MSKFLLEAAKISAAQVGFSTVFNDAMKVEPEAIEALGMTISSSNESEQYNWIGDVPEMEEWLDDRKMANLRNEKFTIENKDWASGIKVHRNDILDDRLGLVLPRIQMLANKARRHAGKTLQELLVNGFDGTVLSWNDGLAYDGQFFFDTDHKDGDGPTQSNKATAALSHTSFDAGLTAMASITDEDSYPLEVNPTHIVVGPSNRRNAKEITQGSHRVVSSASIPNQDAGEVQVIVSKRLIGSYANYWYLADLSQPIRPLIHQSREPVRFDAMDLMGGSDEAFMRAVYKYGASSRAGFGYGMWQFAYGSDGTT